MKEIDFLPDWYKTGRRRQVSFRTQCIALGCVLAAIVVLDIVTSCSVSKAKSQLGQMVAKSTEVEAVSEQYARIKKQISLLQKKESILEKINSKINVANVLAEISFLVDDQMAVNKMEFRAERLADNEDAVKSGSRVRRVKSRGNNKGNLSVGNVKFKVVIGGIASDASKVAQLICKLEDSRYFWQVIPSYSRNKKLAKGHGKPGEDYQVTEFEIGCYLANYQEEIILTAKKMGE